MRETLAGSQARANKASTWRTRGSRDRTSPFRIRGPAQAQPAKHRSTSRVSARAGRCGRTRAWGALKESGRRPYPRIIDEALHGTPCLGRTQGAGAHDATVREQAQQRHADRQAQSDVAVVTCLPPCVCGLPVCVPFGQQGKQHIGISDATHVPCSRRFLGRPPYPGASRHPDSACVAGRRLQSLTGGRVRRLRGRSLPAISRCRASMTSCRSVEPRSTASILARLRMSSGRSVFVRMAGLTNMLSCIDCIKDRVGAMPDAGRGCSRLA